MQTQVNRELVTVRSFDSGALGVLASAIHPFPTPGRYAVQVLHGDREAGSFTLVVDEASESMQLDVDLAKLEKEISPQAQGCDCRDKQRGETKSLVVSPKGYVVFYASTGTGYSVRARLGDAVAFDSQRLGRGDLFCLALFEPTRYHVVDRIGGGKLTIDVTFKAEDARRLRSLEAVTVDVVKGDMKPGHLELTATQGLTFRVHDEARIVAEKGEAAGTESNPPTGPRHWVNPRARGGAKPSRSR